MYFLQKFTEKTIKISQKPNNERGFGFFLAGGCEKKQPVTVQRVSLGKSFSVYFYVRVLVRTYLL